mgnify:CR=1
MTDFRKPSDEKELVAMLDSIDARLEEIGARSSLAHFNRLTGTPHEDLEALNRESAAIMLNAEYRDTIESWRSRSLPPRLLRRLDLFHRAFRSARIDNNPGLFALANRIEEKIIRFQPELDGVKLSRSDLGKVLETEPDRARRERAYRANKALGELIEQDVLELFAYRNDLAKELGAATYVDLGLELADLKESELDTLFDQVRLATEDLWNDTLSDIARKLGISSPAPWDFSYYIHSVLPSPPSSKFPKSGIIPTFRKWLARCGGDLGKLPIEVIEQDIPYGGLCVPIRMGRDIRILTNPRDGLSWYNILFHEFGHGIHASLIDTSSHLVAGGDPSFFWEGIAGVFQWITDMPAFLQDEFGMTDREIADVVRQNRVRNILGYRNIAVACRLEWAIYRRTPDPRKYLEDLLRDTIGIEPPERPSWAGDTLYTTHPLYHQNYLLMDVMATQTIDAVRRSFGTYPAPGMFDFVVDHYVREGGWKPWRDKIAEATGSPLTAQALGHYLTDH